MATPAVKNLFPKPISQLYYLCRTRARSKRLQPDMHQGRCCRITENAGFQKLTDCVRLPGPSLFFRTLACSFTAFAQCCCSSLARDCSTVHSLRPPLSHEALQPRNGSVFRNGPLAGWDCYSGSQRFCPTCTDSLEMRRNLSRAPTFVQVSLGRGGQQGIPIRTPFAPWAELPSLLLAFAGRRIVRPCFGNLVSRPASCACLNNHSQCTNY